MGLPLSKAALTLFEITNELYTALGSGILGVVILTNHGLKHNRIFGTLLVTSLTLTSLIYIFQTKEFAKASCNKYILITGCDSGLGYSLALHASEMGFTVLAGCLNLDSEGAQKLRDSNEHHRIKEFELDVTSPKSVDNAVLFTKDIMESGGENNVLWAIINNAGVMVFGELEWQTENLIRMQLDVNLLGSLRITKSFLPMLRKHKGRLINITSHCSLAALPGLSVYGATKMAMQGFNDAVRVEQAKYGVKVISFIPGSFSLQSNIMSKQMDFAYEMRSAFTKDQEDFYGTFFIKYHSYLSAVAMKHPAEKLSVEDLYERFEEAVLDVAPRAIYVVEPTRYKVYHMLFRWSPTALRDYFVTRFMQMPKYEPVGRLNDLDIY